MWIFLSMIKLVIISVMSVTDTTDITLSHGISLLCERHIPVYVMVRIVRLVKNC